VLGFTYTRIRLRRIAAAQAFRVEKRLGKVRSSSNPWRVTPSELIGAALLLVMYKTPGHDGLAQGLLEMKGESCDGLDWEMERRL
jgi:hypothetical protein